ncbi:uncharacterized protein LOC124151162 [Haliotis rufescens]|uniref:uncharacterized protein LOC124151162 n=1 Tax=Haliotis rufescens TaxID=6454 RepID=UPI00201F588B|nr:uncharacterized protein LOC124151162 [Haliotis rufescens]
MSFSGSGDNDLNVTSTVLEARPYGSTGGQIFFSFIYMLWIVLANGFILFLIVKDKTLRQQPHNVYTVLLCLADLTVGLYYLPLNMDFLSRGRWGHDCSSLGVFAFYPIFNTCFCAFTVFMLMFARLMSLCCCWRQTPMSLKKRFIFHGLSVLIVLVYIFMIPVLFTVQPGTYRNNDRGESIPDFLGNAPANGNIIFTCQVLRGFDFITRFLVVLSGFWAPMFFPIVFLAIILIMITRAGAPEQSNQDKSKVPVKVLIVVFLVSFLIPSGYISYLSCVLPAPCVFLPTQGPDFTCDGAIGGLSVFLQWLLITKCGILPFVWLLGEDYRNAAKPMIRSLEPVLKICRKRWNAEQELRNTDPGSNEFDDIE